MSEPQYSCPLCLKPFRVVKEAPIVYDPEDIAQHYWWHRLDQLLKETEERDV